MISEFNIKNNFLALYRPPQTHVEVLNGWRAMALIFQILHHSLVTAIVLMPISIETISRILGETSYRVLFHGHFVIDIFFALSGFLIGGNLIRDHEQFGKINIKRFYIWRIFRIFPTYFFILIISSYFGLYCVGTDCSSRSILPNILFFNNFLPVQAQYMPWTWTQAIEEQFYVVCPLILIVFYRFRINIMKALASLVLVTILIQVGIILTSTQFLAWQPILKINFATYLPYFDLIYDKPYARFGGIFLGVIAGYIHQNKLADQFFLKKSNQWLTLILGTFIFGSVCFFSNYVPGQENTNVIFLSTYRTIATAGILLMAFGTMHVVPLRNIFRWKIWYSIAQLSYAAYLIHPFIGIAILKWKSEVFFLNNEITFSGVIFFGAIVGLISLVVSIPIYVIVERPFMNIRKTIAV